MTEAINQGQHRISQVYLRQFGFKDKNNKQWISVWKLGNDFTENKSVKSFTKELNIFDLPFKSIKNKRSFEDLNGSIETEYPKIISDLDNYQKLSDKSKLFLISIVANFLCRTEPFRKQIETLLSSNGRDYFLSEITFYHPIEGKQLIEILRKIKISYQLNLVLFSIMDYMFKKLTSSNFNYVIIKDFKSRGWATSDNPVVLINNFNKNTILAKETEIYFPISKKYCLYMDHSDFDKSNSLRGINKQELVESTEIMHEKIRDILLRNTFQYLIFPTYLPKTKLSDINKINNNY